MNNKNFSQPQSSEVIVVEASAGSGKTYALVKRYLQLLINPPFTLEQNILRSILAITFTNKATVEMKERILEFLKRIAFNEFVSKEQEEEIYSSLGVNKEFARQKACHIMNELVQHYSFFQVQTIDSFINTLLLGCALHIDRSASFKIKRDYDQYLIYCLDLVIEKAATDKQVLEFLEDFLYHYLFIENQQGWFPKDKILSLMISLFELSNRYGSLFHESKGNIKDVIKKKIVLFAKIKELAENFPEGLNKYAQDSIKKFIDKGNNIFKISDLPNKFQQALVPMNKNSDCPPEYKKKWEQIHKEIKKIIELDAILFYNPYIKLFNELLDFLQSISKKEDVLFLSELNHKARYLFGEGGLSVAELYYRLATRFKHYLIDEFQDTSILQWRNLEIMIEEALSTGGSLFYVGDKKQAIYRFRGGEAGLFDDVQQKFYNFNVANEYLSKNWRSQKEIVEFNNQVFLRENLDRALNISGINEKLMLSEHPVDGRQAVDEILNVFKDTTQQYIQNNIYGYVCVRRLEEKNQEERNEIMQKEIVDLIKELRQRFSYEDIAILSVNNEEVELITSWLLEARIPVESEKTLNILENSLVKELVVFLKFLQSPIDNLSFAAFILGEIFSAVTGIEQKELQNFIFNLHIENKINSGITLYNLFRQKYSKVWDEYIDKFLRSVGFVSPYEMLISIYQQFNLLEKFKDNQAFFMKFLELIKAKEDEYVGLAEFLLYLEHAQQEDLYVNITRSGSVKILTIHKSKGLEFPVVIIPFLRIDINPETGGKGTSSYVVEDPNDGLVLMHIPQNYPLYSEQLRKIYTEAYKKACIDELNEMYVALTRAQYELYVFIPQRSATGKNKAQFIIPEDIKEKGYKRIYEKKKEGIDQPLEKIPVSKYKDWIELVKKEFGSAGDVKNRKNILQGEVLHTMLSLIGNCYDANLEDIISNAVKNTQIRYSFITDFSDYAKKIRSILNKEELKKIFYVPDGEIFCEKEVVNCFGDIKRIDRLIIKKEEIWVIDYKSNRENEEMHHNQMQEYVDIICQIYPKYQVKGYLVYLDEMMIEQIKW